MLRTKPWDNKAACKTKDASLLNIFYSKKKKDIALAKSICDKCEIKRQCYQKAVENKEPAGIWGGVEFDLVANTIPSDSIIVPNYLVYYPVTVTNNIVSTRKNNSHDASGSILPEVVSKYLEEENR